MEHQPSIHGLVAASALCVAPVAAPVHSYPIWLLLYVLWLPALNTLLVIAAGVAARSWKTGFLQWAIYVGTGIGLALAVEFGVTGFLLWVSFALMPCHTLFLIASIPVSWARKRKRALEPVRRS